MARVKPDLLSKIKRLGAFDVNACFSCGVCTAICPLSEEGGEFPRRIIRYAMLGLEDKLLGSPELWSCYYCGECTRSCPRQADPGGFMMAARRYAITRYSWGRIASVFYSKVWSPIVLTLLSIFMIGGILALHGPLSTGSVNLFKFMPKTYIHEAGIGLGLFILFSAIANLAIMYRYLSRGARRSGKASLKAWIKEFFNILIKEVLWESRYLKCSNKFRFYSHMSIFWGFVLLFIATGIDYITGSRQLSATVLGFIGGALIIFGSGYFIFKRLEGKEEYATYSDFIDWAFLWLIFLSGITGFLLDLFVSLDKPMAAYITFSAHLVVVFDLIVTAPFTKFAHAGYRPFALWIQKVFSSSEKVSS